MGCKWSGLPGWVVCVGCVWGVCGGVYVCGAVRVSLFVCMNDTEPDSVP